MLAAVGSGDTRSVGQILQENLLAVPGRVVSQIGSDITRGVQTVSEIASDPAVVEQATARPPMRVALPLVAGGPGSTALMRLGARAAGGVLDDPKATPAENATTAAKAIGLTAPPGFDSRDTGQAPYAVPPEARPLAEVLLPPLAEALLPNLWRQLRLDEALRGTTP
jgi:hypothetical protein